MADHAVIGSPGMTGDRSSPSDTEQRVVSFRRGRAAPHAPSTDPQQVDDLAKFERGEDADDYRHRMLVNTAAFVFVMTLIGAGLWLADTMAQMRRNQDCALSGRRNCAPIEVPKDRQ
jgi:hypothetical protein